MNGRIRLNLHCHSNLSDGVLTPEALAGLLADEGAVVAALTDHDTVEGAARFRDALSLRGVAFVDAVELTTFCSYGEIHVLAYGIDPESPELLTALSVIGDRAEAELQGFMDYVRRLGIRPHAGKLATEAAIALIHRCGGIAVLAHPLNIVFASGDLAALVDELSAQGLDGLEAVYSPYSEAERNSLRSLAETRGLCVSMGTDFHVPDDPSHRIVIESEESEWLAFRARLLRRSGEPAVAAASAATAQATEAAAAAPAAEAAGAPGAALRRKDPAQVKTGFRLGKFSVRIIAASLLALGLFVVAIFAVSIPYFERILLERKKEMIRELTTEAVSLIAEYAADESSGRTDRAEAQANAIAHIRDIRYGREGKDYFWITDSVPRMLMHPYRKDLEGKDVSDFQDDNGLRVFWEFKRAVREEDQGYVEYLWQWKDDAKRIVPKLSFVKRFDPWGWIIGTGIYLDDVQDEIRALTGRMVWLSVLIALILMLLLVFIALQSLSLEKKKRAADFAMRESKERYRALVEASSEGMVIVVDGACTFANAPFLRLSGYAEAEVVLLKIAEFLVPYPGEEEEAMEFLASLPGKADEPPLACLFRRRSGDLVDVVVNASSFSLVGKKGTVLAVKDARIADAPEAAGAATGMNAGLAELLRMGYFRARLNRRASLVAADAVARRLLGLDGASAPDSAGAHHAGAHHAGPDHAGAERAGFGSLFAEAADWESFYTELVSAGRVVRKAVLLRGTTDGGSPDLRRALVTAAVDDAESQGSRSFSAIIEEPAADSDELAALKDEFLCLEASSRCLDERIPTDGERVPRIAMEASARSAAEGMVRSGGGALVVRSPAGQDIGILTDADLCSRIIAEGRGPDTAASLAMTAPIVSAAEGATWADALRLMREKDTTHVAVRDGNDRVTALVGNEDLVRMRADSFGSLLGAVPLARDLAELGRLRARTGARARLSISGGMRSRVVSGFVSSIGDAIVARVAAFALDELGPSPSPYAFLALGSLGRSESLPSSDQDNAIVYLPARRDVPASEEAEDADAAADAAVEAAAEAERAWFLRLGTRICDGLLETGVPYCPGGVMAKNAAWCGTLAEWERKFGAWIAAPDPEEMLALNMSFDFRAACGDVAVADALRVSVARALEETPAFITQLARDALRRKTAFPQTTAFFQGGEAEIDLKETAAQFALYARLYALRDGIAETNTWRRYEELARRGSFGAALAADCLDSYETLMGMRAERQAAAPKLPLKAFRPREQALLREALAQASLVQKKIAFDFPGSAI